MIAELLQIGRENAQSGREIANMLECSIRDISEQVERERRQGVPICAATGDKPGYYLASSNEELEQYCDKLRKRAIEIFKTRQALVDSLTRAGHGPQSTKT